MFRLMGIILGIIVGIIIFFLSKMTTEGIIFGVIAFIVCLVAGIIMDKIMSLTVKIVIVVVLVLLLFGAYKYLDQPCLWNECMLDETGTTYPSATKSDPIIIYPTLLDLNIEKNLVVMFFCDNTNDCENVKPILLCDGFEFWSVNITIQPSEEIGFSMIINNTENPSGTYPCKIVVDNAEEPGQPWRQEKEFEIEVV